MEIICIDIVPFPRARPRAYRRGKHIAMFDPQAKLMQQLKAAVRESWTLPPLEGPLCLDVMFFMPIPASTSKKRADAMEGALHCKKPDLSNLLKGLEDCMNGIVFLDDAQLCEIKSSKVYSGCPRIEFLCYSVR